MSIHQYTRPLLAIRQAACNPEFIDAVYESFRSFDIPQIVRLFDPEEWRRQSGWKTLHRYIQQLPSTRFFLYTALSRSGDVVVFGLVDKPKLIDLVNRYPDDFLEVLECNHCTPQDLSRNECLDRFLQSVKSEKLIGMLLGYGRENAALFHKYRELKIDFEDRPMVGAWQDLEQARLEQWNHRAQEAQPWDLSDLFYPTFACDPKSVETAQLKEAYLKDRERIVQFYEGKDPVEATLSLLCQPWPLKEG